MKIRTLTGLLAGALLGSAALVPGETGSVSEYRLKAAFLFNFTQYVKWPESAFATPEAPLVIGVLGKDPFEALLDNAIAGETVEGRALEVRRAQRAEELKGCHIVFISVTEKTRLKEVLSVFRDLPVLTVSDAEQFAERCGAVGFVVKEKRVTLHINVAAATRGGLKLDSRLLGLATIVRCEEGR